MKFTNRDRVAFAIQDAGLYPYPEYVELFTAMFENRMNKHQADEIERLISGGMNRNKLSKSFDDFQKVAA